MNREIEQGTGLLNGHDSLTSCSVERRTGAPFATPTWDALADSEKDFWTILLLACSTFFLFLPVITFPFISFDDPGYIYDNPHVITGLTRDNAKWAFTSLHADIAYWHPLTWLSHQLDSHIFGLNSGAHHLTNAMIHVLNTVLLYSFLRYSSGKRSPSAFVAGIFALQPLHVESVAWVSERKDLLCATFYFATLLTYTRFVKKRSSKCYLLSLGLFACSLLSKPMAVTLPVLLLCLEYWPFERFEPGRLINMRYCLEKLPFVVLAFPVVLITLLAQKDVGAVATLEALPVERRLDNVMMAYVIYALKSLWPSHLSIVYVRSDEWPLWETLLAGTALTVLFLCVVKLSLRFNRILKNRLFGAAPLRWRLIAPYRSCGALNKRAGPLIWRAFR